MLDTARKGLHLSKLLLSRLAKPDYVCAPEDPLQTSDTAYRIQRLLHRLDHV